MIATALLAFAWLADPPPAQDAAEDARAVVARARESYRQQLLTKAAQLGTIEQIGLDGEPAPCRALLPRLQDEDWQTRSTAARALGWCGLTEAVDPLIEALGRNGWNDAVEAALERLDPAWRARVATRRTFDAARVRWWSRLRELAAPPPIQESRNRSDEDVAEYQIAELLFNLDPTRARDAFVERVSMPAPAGDCSLWPFGSAPDRAFVADLGRAIREAPDLPCLQEAARILEEVRPDWRKSDEARAAAEVYAVRAATATPEGVKSALEALALLGDPRGHEQAPGAEGAAQEDANDLAGRAHRGDDRAIAALRDCSMRGRAFDRSQCAEALGSLGRKDLVDVYRALLKEPRPPTREEAGDQNAGSPPAPETTQEAEDEVAGLDMAGYYWAKRRAAAVTGLGSALGADALDELRALAANPEEDGAVLSALAQVAAGRKGPGWTDLLLRVAAGGDAERAPGEAIAALLKAGRREALPLLWAGLERGSLQEWQREDLVTSAVQLAPEEAIEHLRALAAGDRAVAPLVALARRQPSAGASSRELVGVLPLLAGGRQAAGPGARQPEADAEAAEATAEMLQHLAEGAPLDRGDAKVVAPLANDADPRIRALARYVLWRSERGR
jgi:hypothetical protein